MASRVDIGLPPAVRDARAIMASWFLGSETGHAIADLVFGDHSPSGRLPVSFPLASGQQPDSYNHRRTGRPQTSPQESAFKARYRKVEHRALYPFGHGLGYGDVVYGPTLASSETLGRNATLSLRATLVNRGALAMREVAQLYIHQRVAAIARPVRELRGFKAVELQPGEAATVEFQIRRSDLAYVGAEGKAVVEPGWFDVVIAPSAVGGASVALRLLAN